jgi:hypothetical protein
MGWRLNVLIQGPLSQRPPALASHGGLLYMAHRGDDSNSLWYARFDGSYWTENRIQGPLSQSAPVLMALAEQRGPGLIRSPVLLIRAVLRVSGCGPFLE